MSFPNIWHHRKVADTSSKACDICFKPTTSVLITPEKQDFFYVCMVHLKDTRFCTPIIDHEAVAAKKKKEMDDELERVKKEYEEKQRLKKEKEDEKSKAKDNEKDNDKAKDSKTDEEGKGKKTDDKVIPAPACCQPWA